MTKKQKNHLELKRMSLTKKKMKNNLKNDA